MANNVRIEHSDGSTDTIPLIQSKVTEGFGKQDLANLTVLRDDLNDITVTEAEDEVFLEIDGTDEFGGLLKDVVRNGSTPKLVVPSFEQYARDAEPTAAGENYDNVNDNTVITDAINGVSQLTAGTVSNIKSGVSFVFSHASQARKIRKVEEVTTGEVRYNTDKSVDYIASLGSDKTATTLSPSSQNIIGDIEVTNKSGDEKITHLRLIGAGEGKHQLTSERTASSWSAGDRKIWRTYSNKDIQDQDALDSLADTLISELNTEHIEIDCNIKGVDVELGDEFHVTYTEENINDDLRVVELTTIIDKQGKRYNAILSNRQKSRRDEETSRRKDIERYNMAVQGVAVPINAGGGRQPVDSTHNYVMKLYYPAEVVYEHRLNVRVMGLNYRAYSQGAAAGGDHTHSVTVDHPSHNHGMDHTHDVDVTHPGHSHGMNHTHNVSISDTSTENTPHGAVAAVGTQTHAIGDTGGTWNQVETVSESNYEMGFVGFSTSGSNAVIEVRARDSSNSSVVYPASSGIPLTGTEFPRTDSVSGSDFSSHSHEIDEGQIGNGLIPIPEDIGFIDIDYRTSVDPQCNLYIWWILLGNHTHDVSDTVTSGSSSTSTTDSQPQTTSSETSGASSTSTTDTYLPSSTSETSDASGDHTHSVDPGIIDTTDYPSNCDVTVNGTSLGTTFGDGNGAFSEVVDISGQLNAGQVNTIEVTSDTLGHVQAYVEGDVYRQILGNG